MSEQKDSKRFFTNDREELLLTIKRNPLILVGLIGLLGAVLFSFTYGRHPSQPINQLTEPPSSPYAKNVSGIGIVEASSKNISVGTFLPGIVNEIFVQEGHSVKKGDPLFKLDTRSAKADVDLKEQEVRVAEESVHSFQAILDEATDQFERASHLKGNLAISQEEKKRREFAQKRAEADVRKAEADLDRAKASLTVSQVILDKMTVYAPTDGLILKIYTKVGESVGSSGALESILLMGNNNPLYLRVQIDENDAWRFQPKTKAKAFLKSNKDISFPLKFVRLDPYASPKQNISGDVQEFVDTRIIHAIYAIDTSHIKHIEGTLPLYIGQQLDVFIETEKGT